ncbi:SpaH/EbpB family LPXTG-anchored major pilin [Amedibacillus sp. YH-ame6]
MKNLIKKCSLFLALVALIFTTIGLSPIHAIGLPDKTQKGSITIHKYALPAGVNGGKATGSINDKNNLPSNAKPLANITFKVTRMKDNPVSNIADAEVLYGDDGKTPVYQKEVTTNVSGEAKVDTLEHGIYLVEELDSPAVETKAEKALISVPMTDPTDETAWLYDIHIFPKNVLKDGPAIDKSVMEDGQDTAGVNANESFPWIIKADIPDDVKDAAKYVITDNLDVKLKFDTTVDVKVYIMDKGNNEIVLTASTDYTVSKPTEAKGGKLTITLTNSGLQKMSDALTSTGVGTSNLFVVFNTKLSEDGLAALGQKIENNASLEYTNSVGTTTSNTSTNTEVHTGGINIEKVDADDTNIKLKNAKFKVYMTEAAANSNDDTKALKDINGNTVVLVTDANGKASASGLAYGTKDDAAKASYYWLVETEAPLDSENKAYRLLSSPIKVKVDASTHLEDNKLIVKNKKSYWELPLTGGVGTTIFTIGGIALIVAGIIILKTKKRDVK